MFRGSQRKNFLGRETESDVTAERRMEDRLQFRRDQRSEGIQKHRRKNQEGQSGQSQGMVQQDEHMTAEQLRNLDQMANTLRSGSPQEIERTIVEIRKLLSMETSPPIQSVINAGIVDDMMRLLRNRQTMQKVRFECAWALTNVASGASQHTQVVVDAGGLDVFVNILATEDGDIREQAVWALGNIAGDCADLRDRVLRANTLNYLLQIFISQSDNRELLRHATWTLSNFCRGKPHVDFEIVKPALGLLKQLLEVDDDEILVDACWAISYISDDPTPTNSRIQEIVEMGFVSKLIQLLSHQSSLVVHPALRAIGNIVTGSDEQTQTVLQHGVLEKLKALLKNDRVNIRKEACWTVSNITAGNAAQIGEVCEAQLIPLILSHLGSQVFDVRKEACWAISNATTGGNTQQINYIVECGAIKPLIGIIRTGNPKIIRVALEGIENILKAGQDMVGQGNLNTNPYVAPVEEFSGFEVISQFENQTNPEVTERIRRILAFSPARGQMFTQSATQFAV